MQITHQTVVTLICEVKDETSGHAQASRKPFSYLHKANNIVQGLEDQLTGKSPGERFNVTLVPQSAYGERRADLVGIAQRSEFTQLGLPEEQIKPGASFLMQTPQGKRPIKILEVDGDNITIDANHPLAGKTFTYDIDILNVRYATEEEIKNGRPQDGLSLQSGNINKQIPSTIL